MPSKACESESVQIFSDIVPTSQRSMFYQRPMEIVVMLEHQRSGNSQGLRLRTTAMELILRSKFSKACTYHLDSIVVVEGLEECWRDKRIPRDDGDLNFGEMCGLWAWRHPIGSHRWLSTFSHNKTLPRP
jgi:hypothetical protein